MTAVWKDCVGYEGFYQVSDAGEVRSLDRVVKHSSGGTKMMRGRVLKQVHTKKGYSQCTFSARGASSTMKIHTLVLEAFLGLAPDGHMCDHINRVRTDNRFENLRWVTPKESIANTSREIGASGFVGVHAHKNTWRALCTENGKRRILGHFIHKQDAIAARAKWENENATF